MVDDPGAWAREREDEGWDGVACADHFWLTRAKVTAFGHLWVTLATMAAATRHVRLQPAFANNLFRHPVEFAQASLSMQLVSHGRYEAGLGAGWLRDELDGTGQRFPDGRERARRLREAAIIVRELVSGRPCRFEGEYYRVDVPALGDPDRMPPPLVASVGSPWTMRHVTPLVDQVELKMGRSTSGGGLDLAALGSVTIDEVRRMIDTVREAKPGVSVSVLVFVGCGTDAAARAPMAAMRAALGDGLYGSMIGEPAAVVARLRGLAELGIDRLQVSQWVPGSFAALAPHLSG